jgi:flagellar biosynthesis protein FlhA
MTATIAPSSFRRVSALLAPAAILTVVLLMVVPLPPFLLDLLLSVDIGLAVVLLLTAIYVKQPVEFSVFPSLLLMLTLIRLALNVASTRLVLLHGSDGVDAAGHVIMSFGQFVVGGNFIVGIVIFVVLVIIQFLVINHGAVRISEVTARFTLDAMPGRQMAVDADLNAGVITDQEARVRRDRVRREADFYGAMDGAIRFTQRDALAAVLITITNIVAGLIIGVFQQGLDLSTAVRTFTILTVGEGLVTSLPALLVSMSGALITTRAASESNLGQEVATQLLARAKPLAVAAGVLVALALIPGLPKLSFLLVAGLLGAAAYANRSDAQAPAAAAAAAAANATTPETVEPGVTVDPLAIEVGYALVTMVDEAQGGTLLARLRSIRKQVAAETGMVVPPVHVADNLQLGPRTYTILVKGVEAARGELFTDRLLAINPGTVKTTLEGVATREPAFGLPAVWIAQDRRDAAIAAGYTVVDPTTAITTHLSEIVRTFLPDLLTRQQTKELIDRVAQTSPKLVEELVPKVVSVGDVQRVLRQLLRERVPMRDLTTILEAMADASTVSKDTDVLVEAVRSALGRSICKTLQGDAPELRVVSLSPSLEDGLVGSIARTDRGAVLAIDPARAQSLALRLGEALAHDDLAQPVLLCSPTLRAHLWRLFSRALPHIAVLSHGEVPPQVRLVSVATLD